MVGVTRSTVIRPTSGGVGGLTADSVARGGVDTDPEGGGGALVTLPLNPAQSGAITVSAIEDELGATPTDLHSIITGGDLTWQEMDANADGRGNLVGLVQDNEPGTGENVNTFRPTLDPSLDVLYSAIRVTVRAEGFGTFVDDPLYLNLGIVAFNSPGGGSESFYTAGADSGALDWIAPTIFVFDGTYAGGIVEASRDIPAAEWSDPNYTDWSQADHNFGYGAVWQNPVGVAADDGLLIRMYSLLVELIP